jgi:flagellar motor switch protein FliG
MADKKDSKERKDGAADPKAKGAPDGKDVKATEEGAASPDIPMTPELREELDALTSTQRAAVLMLLLGEQQAAEIIRYLNPKEVQALGAAMVSVADLSQAAVNVVLDDFVAMLKKQTNLGLGTGDYVEKVLKRALGEDKAASVLSRIMPGQGNKGLEILKWMDARSIAEMIRNEHPQVVAIILSVLEYDVAADVLNFLPPDARPEIMQRVASLETVQPSAMEELESIMKKQFSTSSSAKSSSFGGIKAAAKIMNFVKVDLESQIMVQLTRLDPDLTQKIQDNMFTFENLSAVDNRAIQTLMRNVEPDMLMTALKGAHEYVKEKFFDNMSQRARVMFVDEMESKGPLRITDVEEAQKAIMRIARKLSDKGELVLSGRGDDFV